MAQETYAFEKIHNYVKYLHNQNVANEKIFLDNADLEGLWENWYNSTYLTFNLILLP